MKNNEEEEDNTTWMDIVVLICPRPRGLLGCKSLQYRKDPCVLRFVSCSLVATLRVLRSFIMGVGSLRDG